MIIDKFPDSELSHILNQLSFEQHIKDALKPRFLYLRIGRVRRTIKRWMLINPVHHKMFGI